MTKRQNQTKATAIATAKQVKNPFACLYEDDEVEVEKPCKSHSPPVMKLAPWAKNWPEHTKWAWAYSSDEEDD